MLPDSGETDTEPADGELSGSGETEPPGELPGPGRPDDDTVLIRRVEGDAEPPPIFADLTGRRRRRLKLVAYAVGILGVFYTVMVGVSIAGGSAFPGALVPLPEPIERNAPAPTPSTSPTADRRNEAPVVVPSTRTADNEVGRPATTVRPTTSRPATRPPARPTAGAPAPEPTVSRPTVTPTAGVTPAPSPTGGQSPPAGEPPVEQAPAQN